MKDIPKVYDQVWVMESNKPVHKMIYSITEVMDTCGGYNATNLFFKLVKGKFSAGQGNNKEVGCALVDMYETKEDLLNSL